MGNELRRELKRWGFSESEIDVYIAVLALNEARVSDVANRADVTSRHVYRIVERLEERGLVDVNDHLQPTVIQASPPDHVETVMSKSHDKILDQIESEYAQPSESIGNVDVLNHRPAVVDRCRTMIDSAEEWLILVARKSLLEDLTTDLRDAVDRGVLTLVVTEDGSDIDGRPLGEIASVVRVWEDLETWDEAGLGVDYFQSLYVIPNAAGAAAGSYSPAIYLEQRNMAPRVIGSLLGNEWQLGTEIAVPDPVELPHTFDSFPWALVHAALYRRENVPLRATVEGTSTDTGRTETLTGDVVDVLQGMVEPSRKTFSLERVLMLDTGGEEVSIASPGASIEDYVARSVTLERGSGE
ncbi:MAG: TrmB family transcriptional regulator sugar-binding domain-containing protein [Halococcoides sp.]